MYPFNANPVRIRDMGCVLNEKLDIFSFKCLWISVISYYRQISNLSRTKSQKLNVFRLVLQLFVPNAMKPGVKSRMKM